MIHLTPLSVLLFHTIFATPVVYPELVIIGPDSIQRRFKHIIVTVTFRWKCIWSIYKTFVQHPKIWQFNDPFSTMSHRWNFGNGSFSNLLNPSHIFSGNLKKDTFYQVSLKATTINGCSDNTANVIRIYPFPTVGFIADKKDGWVSMVVRIVQIWILLLIQGLMQFLQSIMLVVVHHWKSQQKIYPDRMMGDQYVNKQFYLIFQQLPG